MTYSYQSSSSIEAFKFDNLKVQAPQNVIPFGTSPESIYEYTNDPDPATILHISPLGVKVTNTNQYRLDLSFPKTPLLGFETINPGIYFTIYAGSDCKDLETARVVADNQVLEENEAEYFVNIDLPVDAALTPDACIVAVAVKLHVAPLAISSQAITVKLVDVSTNTWVQALLYQKLLLPDDPGYIKYPDTTDAIVSGTPLPSGYSEFTVTLNFKFEPFPVSTTTVFVLNGFIASSTACTVEVDGKVFPLTQLTRVLAQGFLPDTVFKTSGLVKSPGYASMGQYAFTIDEPPATAETMTLYCNIAKSPFSFTATDSYRPFMTFRVIEYSTFTVLRHDSVYQPLQTYTSPIFNTNAGDYLLNTVVNRADWNKGVGARYIVPRGTIPTYTSPQIDDLFDPDFSWDKYPQQMALSDATATPLPYAWKKYDDDFDEIWVDISHLQGEDTVIRFTFQFANRPREEFKITVQEIVFLYDIFAVSYKKDQFALTRDKPFNQRVAAVAADTWYAAISDPVNVVMAGFVNKPFPTKSYLTRPFYGERSRVGVDISSPISMDLDNANGLTLYDVARYSPNTRFSVGPYLTYDNKISPLSTYALDKACPFTRIYTDSHADARICSSMTGYESVSMSALSTMSVEHVVQHRVDWPVMPIFLAALIPNIVSNVGIMMPNYRIVAPLGVPIDPETKYGVEALDTLTFTGDASITVLGATTWETKGLRYFIKFPFSNVKVAAGDVIKFTIPDYMLIARDSDTPGPFLNFGAAKTALLLRLQETTECSIRVGHFNYIKEEVTRENINVDPSTYIFDIDTMNPQFNNSLSAPALPITSLQLTVPPGVSVWEDDILSILCISDQMGMPLRSNYDIITTGGLKSHVDVYRPSPSTGSPITVASTRGKVAYGSNPQYSGISTK
jgi:hypothetical protein